MYNCGSAIYDSYSILSSYVFCNPGVSFELYNEYSIHQDRSVLKCIIYYFIVGLALNYYITPRLLCTSHCIILYLFINFITHCHAYFDVLLLNPFYAFIVARFKCSSMFTNTTAFYWEIIKRLWKHSPVQQQQQCSTLY